MRKMRNITVTNGKLVRPGVQFVTVANKFFLKLVKKQAVIALRFAQQFLAFLVICSYSFLKYRRS